MCIVCDIKRMNPSPEVMAKVEELARGLDTALIVAQEVAEANPGAFNDEQRDRMQSAADLLNQREDGFGGLAAILAAILGGARVEVAHVELRDGESPEDAVERYMAEKKAEASKNETKH
ncbi:hypothetical protein Bhz58_00039 [Stenotrophomonas phage vB_SmaS_Bhz58]